MKFSNFMANREKGTSRHLAFLLRTQASNQRSDNLEIFFKNMSLLVSECIDRDIPIMTFGMPDMYDNEAYLERLNMFINNISRSSLINDNQVRISVLGKWYRLKSSLVNSVKKAIEETQSYDRNFLNFCMNYDGQQEIVDAIKIIQKKGEEAIGKREVKEYLYSSYFLPPEKIIVTGKKKSLAGFLLWDSVDSEIVFTGKFLEELGPRKIKEYVHL